MPPIAIDPLIAAAVVVDAVYVLFTNAVLRRRRLTAASWSSIWYLLSSFAVINYTQPPGSSPAGVVARHRPSSRVTEEHYNRASSLSVARDFAALIGRMR